jgi:serpin B
VDVDEEGTEAAAATGVVTELAMRVVRPPPVIFRADHPFVFLIRDNRSGSTLFVGRMSDPSSQETIPN